MTTSVQKMQPNIKSFNKTTLIIKYIITIVIITGILGIFSLFMLQIVSFRNDIIMTNYDNAVELYNGPLNQTAPTLGEISSDSKITSEYQYTPDIWKKFVENSYLTKTDAQVTLEASFIKKGLSYQPTYKTQFYAKYNLENTLDQESLVKFEFPFPAGLNNGEISNAKLIVNGEEIKDAKNVVTMPTGYYPEYGTNSNGLKWEGKLPKKSNNTIEVQYNTVGMSYFNYEGIDNPKKSQDINFTMIIKGTRNYNVSSGLSVDKKEFGDNFVKLMWSKENLYSKPLISVNIGEKLNPSEQVARVYFTVVPIYLVMISIVLFLAYKFAKPLGIFDVVLISILYALFFPLVHYLSSFTIDPTIEIFSGISNVSDFSMPLYLAFAIAFVIIAGLIYYYCGRLTNFKFSTKFIIPCLILFLGFFPLVVTIPEYSILLVLIGIIALSLIVIQTRIKLEKGNMGNL